MLKLIKGATVYAPEKLGVKDVLIAADKICAIEDTIELNGNVAVEVIDGTGKVLTPGFIDTHSHLYDEAFSQEEDSAIERAVEAGVTKMILPDIDSQTREAMFALW